MRKGLLGILASLAMLTMVGCFGEPEPSSCNSDFVWESFAKQMANRMAIEDPQLAERIRQNPKQFFKIEELEYRPAIRARMCVVRVKKNNYPVATIMLRLEENGQETFFMELTG